MTATFTLMRSAARERIDIFLFEHKPGFAQKTLRQQAWIIRVIKQLCLIYPNCPLTFVSRTDVIEVGPSYHLGLLTNAHGKVEIPNAPICRLVVEHGASKFLYLNEVIAA